MRSFPYNFGFSLFTVIDFTDLSPFCLFHQFTSVSPAVPEFLKTPTADQPPTRSTAPVLPTNTVSSAKPGPALVKVGTLHARRFERLYLHLWCVALSTEDKGCAHIAWPAFQPEALKTKPQKDLLTQAFITETTTTFNK